MKWLGRISTFVLLQFLFLGILLFAFGRLPQRELELLGRFIWTGQSALDQPPPSPPAPPEDASYADLVQARINEMRELERKRRELDALARAAQARIDEAAALESKVRKVRADLQKDVKDEESRAVQEGQRKLLELLESSTPKIARGYLLEQGRTDEERVVSILKQLDPAVAAKVFKEFKQPAELGKLNGWLAKLGQGEPEASQIRKLRKQTPPTE